MKPVYYRLFKITLICLIMFLNADISLARDIRVKLSDAGRHNISSNGAITLTDSANKSHTLGKSITISVSGGAATVAGKRYSLPATLKSNSPIGFNGFRYRGTLRVTRSGELINVLNIEDYLRGVLKAEANPNWSMEYLKVQAIVSRTYAMREIQGARSRSYDVTDTISSQVYHGINAETQRTDQAVRETKDKVLVYGNELAFTPFHSDSGGATANNSDVWGKELPYLRATREPMSYQSPNSSWEVHIPESEVSIAVRKVTPNVGVVRDIKIINTDSFGRAVNLQITGSASSATMRASAFRTAIGPNRLKSTFLTFPATNEASQTSVNTNTESNQAHQMDTAATNMKEELTPQEDAMLTQLFSEGAFSNAEMMEILMKPEKRKEFLYRALIRPKGSVPTNPTSGTSGNVTAATGKSIPFANGHFIFRGKGWGHGVGMSQYGAMNLARSGWNAERILTHYYPGTQVKAVTTQKK